MVFQKRGKYIFKILKKKTFIWKKKKHGNPPGLTPPPPRVKVNGKDITENMWQLIFMFVFPE